MKLQQIHESAPTEWSYLDYKQGKVSEKEYYDYITDKYNKLLDAVMQARREGKENAFKILMKRFGPVNSIKQKLDGTFDKEPGY